MTNTSQTSVQKDAGQQPGRRRDKRRLWGRLWGLWGAVGCVLLIVVIANVLPSISQAYIRQALQDQGFTEAEVSVQSLGLGHLELRDLVLTPDVSVAEIDLTFDPWQLFQNLTVRHLRIAGVRLDLPDGTDSPFVQQLQAMTEADASSDTSAAASPTVEDLVIEDVSVSVGTPMGTWVVQSRARGSFVHNLADVDVQWELTTPLGLPGLWGQAELDGGRAHLFIRSVADQQPILGTIEADIQTQDIFNPAAPIAVNADIFLNIAEVVAARPELAELAAFAPTGFVRANISGATTQQASTAGDVPELTVILDISELKLEGFLDQGEISIAARVRHADDFSWQAQVTEVSSVLVEMPFDQSGLMPANLTLQPNVLVTAEVGPVPSVTFTGDVALTAGPHVTLAGPISLAASAEGGEAYIPDCLRLSTQDLNLEGLTLPATAWCLRSGDGPLLEWSETAQSLNVQVAPQPGDREMIVADQLVRLTAPFDLSATQISSREGIRLDATLRGLSLDGEPLIDAFRSGALLATPLRFEGDVDDLLVRRANGVLTVTVPEAADLRANVGYRQRPDGSQSFSFDLQPTVLSPARGAAILEAIPVLKGVLEPEAGRFLASAVGRLDPLGQLTGYVDVVGETLRFAVPLEGDVIVRADKVEVQGPIRWSPEENTANLDVLIQDMGVQSEFGRADRINGVIQVMQLMPLATAPQQEIAIATLDAGAVLPNGLIRFDVQDQDLNIHRAEWSFAGGQVAVEDIPIVGGALPEQAILVADNLRLDVLLPLLGIEGLAGNGLLSGRIPVRFSEGRLNLSGGVAALEPGVLQFDSRQTLPGLPTEAEGVLAVLEDFRYDTLALDIEPAAAGREMILRLRLFGRNPQFRQGIPVNLNINLEGDFEGMARAGLTTYDLPARIADQMYNFPASTLQELEAEE